MVQPILSGLTLVYVVTPKRSPLMKTGPIETLLAGVKDATISATYAMLAAHSLGLKTGMFGSIEQNSYTSSNAVKLFSNDPNSIITLSVTVANSLVETPDTVGEKHFFKYKGDLPYVMYKKHKAIINSPEIIKL
jgi:hypothetical protein